MDKIVKKSRKHCTLSLSTNLFLVYEKLMILPLFVADLSAFYLQLHIALEKFLQRFGCILRISSRGFFGKHLGCSLKALARPEKLAT